MVLIYLKLIKADYSAALTAVQTAYLATEGALSVNRPDSPLGYEPFLTYFRTHCRYSRPHD